MGKNLKEANGTLLIRLSALIGVLACLGNVYIVYILGSWCPGYSPFFQAMSDLGHEDSPVARMVSTWWVIMGVMFIIFGYGFYRAFFHYVPTARTAGWMLAMYGIGEGLGSGLIPATSGKMFETPGSIFHALLGGAGVTAAILLPPLIIRMFDARKWSALYWYSWFTTVSGGLFVILFLISNFYHPEGKWISCLGLWQRLFVLMYYLFFIYLAILMLAGQRRSRAPVETL